MLRPYPDQIPPEALTLVLSAFQGQPVNKNKAIHAASEVACFALGKLFPDDEPAVVGAVVTDAIPQTQPIGSESIAEVVGAFNSAIEAANGPQEIDGRPVAQLSPMVIDLILRVALEILRRR